MFKVSNDSNIISNNRAIYYVSLPSANSIYTSFKNHLITCVMILEFVAIVIYISNYGFEYVTGNFMIMISFGLLFVLFQLKHYEITPVKTIRPLTDEDNQTSKFNHSYNPGVSSVQKTTKRILSAVLAPALIRNFNVEPENKKENFIIEEENYIINSNNINNTKKKGKGTSAN